MSLKNVSSISVFAECDTIRVGGKSFTVTNRATTKTAGDVVKVSVTGIHIPELVQESQFNFKSLIFVGIYALLVFAVLIFGK
jgi:hypothetical protein